MKTIVTFTASVQALLVSAYGEPVADRILNACQGAMNDPKTVTATDGKATRGAVKGGMTYKADGTLSVKDMAWGESARIDYTAKQTAPIEFVKFNDAIVALNKKCGEFSGPLVLDILPRYLREWTDKVAANAQKPASEAKPASEHKGNGRGVKPAVEPATA